MSYWHGRLNSELFDRELKRVKVSCGKTGSDMPYPVYGYYDSEDNTIHIDSRCKTKAHVLSTLAHEMVHQLQEQRGLPLTHGRFFQAWEKKLKKYGLDI